MSYSRLLLFLFTVVVINIRLCAALCNTSFCYKILQYETIFTSIAHPPKHLPAGNGQIAYANVCVCECVRVRAQALA